MLEDVLVSFPRKLESKQCANTQWVCCSKEAGIKEGRNVSCAVIITDRNIAAFLCLCQDAQVINTIRKILAYNFAFKLYSQLCWFKNKAKPSLSTPKFFL